MPNERAVDVEAPQQGSRLQQSVQRAEGQGHPYRMFENSQEVNVNPPIPLMILRML